VQNEKDPSRSAQQNGIWVGSVAGGSNGPFAWDWGPDGLQEPVEPSVDPHMKRTTEHTKSASAPATRVLRRARSAAVVTQPRFELGYDRESKSYVLALV